MVTSVGAMVPSLPPLLPPPPVSSVPTPEMALAVAPPVVPWSGAAQQGLTDLMRALAQAGPFKPDNRPPAKPTDPLPVAPQGQPLTVQADRQQYDLNRNAFVAEGGAIARFENSELKADRLEARLNEREVVATGNIVFVRGDQQLQGTRLTYNYGTRQGKLENARGFVNLGTLDRPTAQRLPPGSVVLSLGGDGSEEGGGIRRVGFTARELTLNNERWEARDLRLTTDPFAPPELEITTPRARLAPISPTQDRLEAESPRLVFDRVVSLPLPISTLTLDRFRNDFPIRLGFDRQERGGFFYQQNFDVLRRDNLNLQISPQLFVQRGLNRGNLLDANLVGVVARLEARLGEREEVVARASIPSLDFGDLANQLRFNATYRRPILGDHTLETQLAYRDRLFNGSLGLQDVRGMVGFTVFSPVRPLGNTGLNWRYQAGGQYLTAEQDDTGVVTVGSLVRVQTAVTVDRRVSLWRGEPLPATPDRGLRYTPQPLVPSLDAFWRVTGALAAYGNGDTQSSLTGTVGLAAELGNFSRPVFDYTRLNFSYSQGWVGGRSPFLFDRIVDREVLSAGIVQQVFGPVRIGWEQRWSLTAGQVIDATYTLEYQRRTYALALRYSPQREIGEIWIRLSDFNWRDPPPEVTEVESGLERGNP
ncbi:MAG: DUF3769 domain-containing protein [Pseudanabaenaceae cyanobacterium]